MFRLTFRGQDEDFYYEDDSEPRKRDSLSSDASGDDDDEDEAPSKNKFEVITVDHHDLPELRRSLVAGGNLRAGYDVGEVAEGSQLLAGCDLDLETFDIVGLEDGDELDPELHHAALEALAALADDAKEGRLAFKPAGIVHEAQDHQNLLVKAYPLLGRLLICCGIMVRKCNCRKKKWRRNRKFKDRVHACIIALESTFLRLLFSHTKSGLEKRYDVFIASQASDSDVVTWIYKYLDNRSMVAYHETPCQQVRKFVKKQEERQHHHAEAVEGHEHEGEEHHDEEHHEDEHIHDDHIEHSTSHGSEKKRKSSRTKLHCLEWLRRREHAVKASHALIVVLTDDVFQNAFVVQECIWAWKHGIPILPICREGHRCNLIRLRRELKLAFSLGLGAPRAGPGASRQVLYTAISRAIVKGLLVARLAKRRRKLPNGTDKVFIECCKRLQHEARVLEEQKNKEPESDEEKEQDSEEDFGVRGSAATEASVVVEEPVSPVSPGPKTAAPTEAAAQKSSLSDLRRAAEAEAELQREKEQAEAEMKLRMGRLSYELEERVYGVISALALHGQEQRRVTIDGVDALRLISKGEKGCVTIAEFGGINVVMRLAHGANKMRAGLGNNNRGGLRASIFQSVAAARMSVMPSSNPFRRLFRRGGGSSGSRFFGDRMNRISAFAKVRQSFAFDFRRQSTKAGSRTTLSAGDSEMRFSESGSRRSSAPPGFFSRLFRRRRGSTSEEDEEDSRASMALPAAPAGRGRGRLKSAVSFGAMNVSVVENSTAGGSMFGAGASMREASTIGSSPSSGSRKSLAGAGRRSLAPGAEAEDMPPPRTTRFASMANSLFRASGAHSLFRGSVAIRASVAGTNKKLTKEQEDLSIAENSLACLRNIACRSKERKDDILNAGGAQIAVKAMTVFSFIGGESTRKAAAGLLRNLSAEVSQGPPVLAAAGVLSVAEDELALEEVKSDVQRHLLATVQNMAAHPDAPAAYFKNGATERWLDICAGVVENARAEDAHKILVQALSALSNLALVRTVEAAYEYEYGKSKHRKGHHHHHDGDQESQKSSNLSSSGSRSGDGSEAGSEQDSQGKKRKRRGSDASSMSKGSKASGAKSARSAATEVSDAMSVSKEVRGDGSDSEEDGLTARTPTGAPGSMAERMMRARKAQQEREERENQEKKEKSRDSGFAEKGAAAEHRRKLKRIRKKKTRKETVRKRVTKKRSKHSAMYHSGIGSQEEHAKTASWGESVADHDHENLDDHEEDEDDDDDYEGEESEEEYYEESEEEEIEIELEESEEEIIEGESGESEDDPNGKDEEVEVSESAASSARKSSSMATASSKTTDGPEYEISLNVAKTKVPPVVLESMLTLLRDASFGITRVSSMTTAATIAALCNFAQDLDVERSIGALEGIDLVLKAMAKYKQQPVHLQGLRFLWNMSFSHHNQEKLMSAGGLPWIFTAMTVHRRQQDAPLQEQGCGVIRNLATGPPKHKRQIFKQGCIGLLCRTLMEYPSHPGAAQQAAAGIRILAENAPPVAEEVCEVDGMRALIISLRSTGDDPELTDQLLHAIELVLITPRGQKPFCRSNGHLEVLKSMERFMYHGTVQRACRSLAGALCKHADFQEPELTESENESEDDDDPAMQMMSPQQGGKSGKSMNALQLKKEKEERARKRAIEGPMRKFASLRMRLELLEQSAIEKLCNHLEVFADNLGVVEAVVGALRNLVMEIPGAPEALKPELGERSDILMKAVEFWVNNETRRGKAGRFLGLMLTLYCSLALNEKAAVCLYRQQAADKALAWMNIYIMDPVVQCSGCAFLKNFAAAQLRIRQSIVEAGGVGQVADLLVRFRSNKDVVEEALRALHNFAMADGCGEEAAEHLLVRRTLNAMDVHRKSPVITTNGFALLWNISTTNLINSAIFAQEGVERCQKAMLRFADKGEVVGNVGGVLRNLLAGDNGSDAATILSSGRGFETIRAALYKHRENPFVSEQLLAVLSNITILAGEHLELLAQEMMVAREVDRLLTILEEHLRVSAVQYQGFALISRLVAYNREMKPVFNTVVPHALQMLVFHRNTPVVDMVEAVLEEIG